MAEKSILRQPGLQAIQVDHYHAAVIPKRRCISAVTCGQVQPSTQHVAAEPERLETPKRSLLMKGHLPADVVRTLRAWAAAQPEIMRVHIFGSRVRGVSKRGNPVRSDSDLDIAIELSPDVPNPALHWIENSGYWRATLAVILPYPIDLDLLERGFPIVRKYVDVAGALIYERNDQAPKRRPWKSPAPGVAPARNPRLR